MKVSNHAQERYAQRIRDINDTTDIKSYIAKNSEVINENIEMMIKYGTLVYQGANLIDQTTSSNVSIYINHTWIIIYDEKADKVVTLYSIDLGLGKDFNDKYIKEIMDKVQQLKMNYESEKEAKENQSKDFKERIETNNQEIMEYRRRIKGLELENANYQALIDSNIERVHSSGEQLRELVSTLIKKKVY